MIKNVFFKENTCFQKSWVGLDNILPINVIVGKNNSGKTAFIRFLSKLTNRSRNANVKYRISIPFNSPEIQSFLNQNPNLIENINFLNDENITVEFSINEANNKSWIHNEILNYPENLRQIISSIIDKIMEEKKTYLWDRVPFTITSDNDFVHEGCHGNWTSRKIIDEIKRKAHHKTEATKQESFLKLCSDFKKITEEHFLEKINALDGGNNNWEIVFKYLNNPSPIELINSGEGFKKILAILVSLILLPELHRNTHKGYVYFFEEIENNLHPRVLRNLLKYILEFSVEKNISIFLTTHSSVVIDYFRNSSDAQIIHIKKDNSHSRVENVIDYRSQSQILDDLGVKASDLLQANGLIWVEGPSDRIYVNKWIKLVSNNAFKEGHHYQIVFFSGSNLASHEAIEESESERELINILRVNKNVALICDSDKISELASLKPRVKRVKEEFQNLNSALFFETKCKEIENYLTNNLLQRAYNTKQTTYKEVGQYENFFTQDNADKVNLAQKCTEKMEIEDLCRFNLKSDIEILISKISDWNM